MSTGEQYFCDLKQPIVEFVKCWHIFLDLSSLRPYRSSGKEKESCCFVLTSYTKREIRNFHDAVVLYKKRDARAKCRRCRCLRFLLSFKDILHSSSHLPYSQAVHDWI